MEAYAAVVKRRRKTPGSSKRVRVRLSVFVAILVVIVTLFVWLINSSLMPAVLALSEARVRTLAMDALLDSILISMDSNAVYAELLETYDNGERMYMLAADTLAMNRLAAQCTNTAQDKLSNLGEQGVNIALGTITGIPILSGIGPPINIRFTPAGSVRSEFESSLVNSGINQTLYRVKIILTAEVYIILPGISHSVEVSAQTAIAESVIIGDVPQVYTDVSDEEDMLNLIPTELP